MKKTVQSAKAEIIKKILMTILTIVLAIVFVFIVIYKSGLHELKKQAVTFSDCALYDVSGYQKPQKNISYNGEEYRYNEDLYVVLCMGIDTENDMVEEGTSTGVSGQSDANFLAVLDEKRDRISIIAIPRDTMAQVQIYDEDGQYSHAVEAQLALQYAYGNGGRESCMMMQRTVSGLLYEMPINAYVSFNLHAIEILNGSVLGVPVTLEEDFEGYHAGETVTLRNEEAYRYIRERDCDEAYSADSRLKRQKQYLTAFVKQAIWCTKEDWKRPFVIYRSVSDCMITDIEEDELFSLGLLALKSEFSEQYFYRIPGQQVQGEVYEEYQINKDELFELVLEVFYIKEA